MKLISKNNYMIGLLVWLTHPDPNYIIGERNPATGTPYECEGTITQIDKYLNGFLVEWKNGITNHYKENELSAVKGSGIGNCITIW